MPNTFKAPRHFLVIIVIKRIFDKYLRISLFKMKIIFREK